MTTIEISVVPAPKEIELGTPPVKVLLLPFVCGILFT
jgi:hypothetical protein